MKRRQPVVYVFCVCVCLSSFSDLRNDWLAGGDVARNTQTSYTVRVERIPRAFRSPAILQKFFSTLFPGQVRVRPFPPVSFVCASGYCRLVCRYFAPCLALRVLAVFCGCISREARADAL